MAKGRKEPKLDLIEDMLDDWVPVRAGDGGCPIWMLALLRLFLENIERSGILAVANGDGKEDTCESCEQIWSFNMKGMLNIYGGNVK